MRRVLADPWAAAAGIVIASYVVVALTAPLIVRLTGRSAYEYHTGLLDDTGLPQGLGGGISGSHWFGVEPTTGRDLFAIVVLGARTSMFVGIGATVLAVAIGLVLGLWAGYYGGWVDRTLSRTTDVVLGFPFLIFAIALGAIVSDRWPRPVLLVFVIGCFGWPSIARVVRGQTLSLKERGFVRAAQALGAPARHVLVHQLLPNLVASVIVFGTISIPGSIGAEAALSFLGVGVTPPTPSWGRSIGDAVGWVQTDPTYLVFPGAALVLITLAFNVFGDALRDVLDPRTAGAR